MTRPLHSPLILILLGAFLASGENLMSQNFNSKVEALIQINDEKDDLLEVVGTAINKTEGNYSLRYELSVITSNENSNTSKNSQSGRFTLEAFETKSLSRTSVSINPDHRTIILLLIYNEEDELLGTNRLVYDSEATEKAAESLSFEKPNEGIEITGMVTEDTKTKPGKDFYSFFYQRYNLSQIEGNRIVEIEELINFGRTTRILVKVEDRIVFQFLAKPNLDYLKEMADEALKQVNRYFEYLKNRNESHIRY